MFGNQIITFDFRESARAENFNRINYKIIPQGIYEGGLLTRVDDTTVSVSPLVLFIQDTTNSVGLRCETVLTDNVSAVSSTNSYIVAKLNWQNSTVVGVSFTAVASGSLTSSDVIIGKAEYIGSVMQVDFDYTERTVSPFLNIGTKNDAFKLFYNDTTSVGIKSGSILINGINNIFSQTTISGFTLPVSSNGRTDLIVLNESGAIEIIEGEDSVGAPVPYDIKDKFPLGQINFPSGATIILGSYIQNYNFDKVFTLKNNLIHRLNNVDISSGVGSTSLVDFKSNGADPKMDGTIIRIGWSGGNDPSTKYHTIVVPSGWTITNGVDNLEPGDGSSTFWLVGYGSGELYLEKDEANSRWIIVGGIGKGSCFDKGEISTGKWYQYIDKRLVNMAYISLTSISYTLLANAFGSTSGNAYYYSYTWTLPIPYSSRSKYALKVIDFNNRTCSLSSTVQSGTQTRVTTWFDTAGLTTAIFDLSTEGESRD